MTTEDTFDSDGAGGTPQSLSQYIEVWGKSVRFVDVGDGHPVVLVHGTGGAWEVWRENIGDLAGRHRVIALDLPGFGESEPLDGRHDPPAHAQVVSELLRRRGVAPAVVVGHSLGGLVCLHLALSHPEQVASLILVDSGGLPLPRRRIWAIAAGLQAVRILMRSRRVTDAIRNTTVIRQAALGFVVRTPNAFDAELLDGAFLWMRAPGVGKSITAAARDVVVHRLRDVGQPTLLIWGEFDRLLPIRLARRMADAVPNATLKIIKACGHSPNIEYPQLFNAEVSRWVARTHPAAGGGDDVETSANTFGTQTASQTTLSTGGLEL
jgi:pimeloyl-ACP methyl ester carboxylesterase